MARGSANVDRAGVSCLHDVQKGTRNTKRDRVAARALASLHADDRQARRRVGGGPMRPSDQLVQIVQAYHVGAKRNARRCTHLDD